MARICYVILAHNEPANLLGLIGTLWNPDDAFSIWVDAKADPGFIQFVSALPEFGDNIHPNVGKAMSWGGFSIVETTMTAYSALRRQVGDFSHVVLCSGTHVPLLHPDVVYERIRACAGWVDLCQCAIPEGGLREPDGLPRGWLRDILMRIRYRYTELPAVRMLPTDDRQAWIGPNLLEGSQWHVLRSDLVDFIVEHQSEIRANFSDVLVPDEHAFQWIVSKSPQFGEVRRGDHVFMNWEGASPKRLSFVEASELAARDRFLFARKAQASLTAEDWIVWARDHVPNGEGSQWMQDALSVLPSEASDPEANGSVAAADLRNTLLGALQTQISAVLRDKINSERRSESRYLIDTGRQHSLGSRIFFLCFFEPSFGISVVPALRHADLVDGSPLRSRPRVPSFWEYINLPIGGRVGWTIRPSHPIADCEEFARSALAECE